MKLLLYPVPIKWKHKVELMQVTTLGRVAATL